MSTITIFEDGILKASFNTGSAPVQPPVQPPIPPGGGADVIWQIEGVSEFPSSPAAVTGTIGFSIQFATNPQTLSDYPQGAVFRVNDDSAIGKAKEFVISTHPHDFMPVDSDGRSIGSINPFINATFNGLKVAGCCQLFPNQVYYLNFRPVDPAETTYVQLEANARSGGGFGGIFG